MWERVSNPGTHSWMGTRRGPARVCDGPPDHSEAAVGPQLAGRSSSILLLSAQYSCLQISSSSRPWKCSFPGILLQPQAPCACHISHVLSSFPALSRAVQCLTTLLNPWNDFLQVAQTQRGWGAAECGTAVTFLCSLCLSSHLFGHKLPVRLPSPTLKETVCSHSQRLEKSHVGWINDYQASAKGFS